MWTEGEFTRHMRSEVSKGVQNCHLRELSAQAEVHHNASYKQFWAGEHFRASHPKLLFTDENPFYRLTGLSVL